jgi:hypothetical protein
MMKHRRVSTQDNLFPKHNLLGDDILPHIPNEDSPPGSPSKEAPRKKVASNVETHAFAINFQVRSVAGLNRNAVQLSRTSTQQINHETLSQGGDGQSKEVKTPDLGLLSRGAVSARGVREKPSLKEMSTFQKLAGVLPLASNDDVPAENEAPSNPKDAPKENPPRKIVKLHKIPSRFRMSERTLKGRGKLPPIDVFLQEATHPQTKRLLRKPSRAMVRADSFVNILALGQKQFCRYFAEPPEDGTLLIDVTDTGCGMTEGDAAKLFQCFAQANRKVQSKFGGTGLGLWLCHKLIAAMKGEIKCTSVLGKGTTFSITLPLKCKSITSKPEESQPQSPAIFKNFFAVCYLKNIGEVEASISKLGCQPVSCDSLESVLAVLRVPEVKNCVETQRDAREKTAGAHRRAGGRGGHQVQQD